MSSSSSDKGFSLRELTRRWTAGREPRRAGPIVLRERYATRRQDGDRWSAGASRTIGGALPQWATEEETSRPEAWAGLPLLLPMASGGRSHRRIRRSWKALRSREGWRMRPSLLISLLLVLGTVVLVSAGSSTTRAKTMGVAAVEVGAESRATLPMWLGGAGALVAGLVVVAAGMWKKA